MKRNMILILVCALIAGFYYWDTERVEKETLREEKEKELFVIQQDNVAEITLNKGDDRFKAVKQGDHWQLIEPFETSADQRSFDAIARNFADSKRQRVIQSDVDDVSSYGLAEPVITVSLSGIDGATQATMLLGDETPTGGKYYAAIQGSSDVVTVSSNLFSSVDKSLYDLRDRTVLDFQNADVQKVEINHGEFAVTLERNIEGDWLMIKPASARVDQSKINDMLSGVQSSEIPQFIEEKPESLLIYGLIEPATTITLWTGELGNESGLAAKSLVIGSSSTLTENWYAKRAGQEYVFTVKPSDFTKVPIDLDNLRLRKLTSLRSWDVNYFKISSAGSVILEASKTESDWNLLQPEAGVANYTTVSDVLRAVVGLEAAVFVDEGTQEEFEIDKPVFIVELKSGDKTETLSLADSKEDDGGIPYYMGARVDPLELYGVSLSSIEEVLQKVGDVKLETPPNTKNEEDEAPSDEG